MINDADNLQRNKSFYSRSLEKISNMKFSQKNFIGRVLSYDGQVIEATALPAIIGSLCTIYSKDNEVFFGEVVGVRDNRVDILPYESNLT